MFPKSLLLLSLFAFASCAAQRRSPEDLQREVSERIHSKSRPAILFVGNSYSFGVPAALEKIAAKHGQSIRTGHSTNGGWKLSQHAKHEATLRKIRSGHWDIVVLQEYSETPAMPFWIRRPAMIPAVRSLAKEARDAGAIPVLYQTWGRRDGNKAHPFLCPFDNFLKMSRRLRSGYASASEACGGILIIPAGDFWEREVISGHGGELFQPDGSHPTDAGNHLTATAFHTSLFR